MNSRWLHLKIKSITTAPTRAQYFQEYTVRLSPLLILFVCIKALAFSSAGSRESAGFSRDAENPPPWVGMLRGSKVANPSLFNRRHPLVYRDAGFCNVIQVTAKHALVPAHCLEVPEFNQCLKVTFKKDNQPISINVTRYIMAPRNLRQLIRTSWVSGDLAILELEHSVDQPVPALDLYKHTKYSVKPNAHWHRMFSSRHKKLLISGYGRDNTFANEVVIKLGGSQASYSYYNFYSFIYESYSSTTIEAVGAPIMMIENEKAVVFGFLSNYEQWKVQSGYMIPLFPYRDFIKKYIGPELDRSGFALGYEDEEINPTDSLINGIFGSGSDSGSGSGSGIMDEVVLPYPEDWTTVQCHPSTEDGSSVITIPYHYGWNAVNCRPPKEEIPSNTPTPKAIINPVHEATIKAPETDAQPVRYPAQIDEHYSASALDSYNGHSTYLMGVMMTVLGQLIISQGF